MNTPENLKSGDEIAIVAIGKKISFPEIEKSIKFYESWGLKVNVSKTIGVGDSYLAGSDELKISELQSYINNPKIKAIMFARGGYGAVRIIDSIDFSPLIENNKWMVGFSDVTVIHNHLNSQLNLASVHGIMPVFFEDASDGSIDSCKKALFNGVMNYEFTLENSALTTDGEGEGEIVGGNLSIIYSLCGSASSLNTKEKILFIEDLHEPLYHIDRMLQNLKRNGMFEGLAGIIIGRFTHIDLGTPSFSDAIETVFKAYFKNLNIPICFGFPSGHIDNNHALIFGQKVKMQVSNNNISIKTLN
ncbi:MAG: muramoyltetrapeptide carboxypeptidase [Saprospiraceae bacterium]|jgi:muramoyltetrapeptide carboxypeptidase